MLGKNVVAKHLHVFWYMRTSLLGDYKTLCVTF